ncbi:pyridoxamine 5'-phosphate oxidase family protein [Amphritea pacifica]|uniref:Pyridoxamine 5'-phosphate oxidase family protein n=1 Tax=Amphritea pacifica TaxID=2811233 RepID=A0ABS2W7B6_9GAMM|nr:pyridoxamine 5'-phosphate oxidase family protein [Amphritea pacifica]MBN0987603.1 pyridoxamine 5'-phosphate oxidase family protein [Amphritea pacifica]MBN1007448.1 pyridoxamine 5'-phosphate oxidase family protein [Amphritea pacifica]
MGQQFTELSTQHIEFIGEQKIYFVATAAATGHVNLSPKGGDSLRVISPTRIAWLNLTGSGNESAAHVLQNPRMTLMFCDFQAAPLILRAYGDARVLHRQDPDWCEYRSLFPASEAARQIFILDINLVQSSCGMSVPLFDYKGDRDALTNWAEKKGKQGIEAYWYDRNQQSLDGFDTEIVERTGISAPEKHNQ